MYFNNASSWYKPICIRGCVPLCAVWVYYHVVSWSESERPNTIVFFPCMRSNLFTGTRSPQAWPHSPLRAPNSEVNIMHHESVMFGRWIRGEGEVGGSPRCQTPKGFLMVISRFALLSAPQRVVAKKASRSQLWTLILGLIYCSTVFSGQ